MGQTIFLTVIIILGAALLCNGILSLLGAPLIIRILIVLIIIALGGLEGYRRIQKILLEQKRIKDLAEAAELERQKEEERKQRIEDAQKMKNRCKEVVRKCSDNINRIYGNVKLETKSEQTMAEMFDALSYSSVIQGRINGIVERVDKRNEL